MRKAITVLGLIGFPVILSQLSAAVPRVVSLLIFINFDVAGFSILAALGAAAGGLQFGDIAFRSFLIAIL